MTFRTMAEEKRTRSRGKVIRAKRGDTVLWCDNCGRYVVIPKKEDGSMDYDGSCPMCGKTIYKMRCVRCGREWYPRAPTMLPGTCPSCKSPYYNKSRVRKLEKSTVTIEPSAVPPLEEETPAMETPAGAIADRGEA